MKNGAHIIVTGWGVTASSALADAIRGAANHGVIIVAASGNLTNNVDVDANRLYPGSYDAENLVTVVATTKTDGLATYSNHGKIRTHLGAPGGSGTSSPNAIYSTDVSTSYAWRSGTSMAAAHVAGALALLKAQFPTDSYVQLINRLLRNTTSLAALAGKCQTGGKLNLHLALTSQSSSPANDNFASAFDLALPSGQTSITAVGNNIDATTEASEPNHAGNAGGKSAWWKWTAPSSGTFSFLTKGSGFNTTLAVYTGSSVGALTIIATNSVSTGCGWSQVSFSATASTTYRIAIGGYNGEMGLIKLTLQSGTASAVSTLSFVKSSVTRSGTNFSVNLTGPASTVVKIDRSQNMREWTEDYASITLSGSGTYSYTDMNATQAANFYRARTTAGLTSCNTVGYADVSITGGVDKMIANPFDTTNNTIAVRIPNPTLSSRVFKWNEGTGAFDSSLFQEDDWAVTAWSVPGMTLAPGEGVIFRSTSSQTLRFFGEVLKGYQINPVSSEYSLRS